MTDTDLLIQNLRRENKALRAAYHEIAEDLVAFGRVDYWLCVAVGDFVTHWMPLPKPRKETDYAKECSLQKMQ